jgi:hypothetical protein
MAVKSQYAAQIAIPRVAISIVTGALFYLAWMAAFIVLPTEASSLLRGLLWAAAPVVTALGFLTGSVLFSRFRRLPRLTLGRLCLFPLIGCVLGASAVFPFGPMLIVFGMCLGGSLSMVLHELVWLRKIGAAHGGHEESTDQAAEAVQPRLDVSDDR